MIVAVGTDLVDVARIRKILDRSERFLERVYTPSERADCESRADPAESFAARFAAKEAVMKCLESGWADGVSFDQIEVHSKPSGAVEIALHGRAAEIATAAGIGTIHLSLAHTAGLASAFAVASRDTG